MVSIKITGFESVNRTKQINTLYGQNAKFWNVQDMVGVINSG